MIDSVHLGLGVPDAAEEKMQQLKIHCRQVNGTFGLLWHNFYFLHDRENKVYPNVLGGL